MNHTSRRNWMKQATLGTLGLGLSPVVVGKPSSEKADPTTIRLSANENPYGPSKKAIQAMKEALENGGRYPFHKEVLKSELADHHNLKPTNVLLGAGSSQILQVLGDWVLNSKKSLLSWSPTFEILPGYVRRLGGSVDTINLTDDFQYDFSSNELLSKSGVIYLVNPNNPTGVSVNKEKVLGLLKSISQDQFLILDEAYIEYLGEEQSVADIVTSYPNLIVVRTFSKIYGLAGLRVGYLLAHEDTVKSLEAFQIWNADSLSNVAIAAARASLQDDLFVRQSLTRNMEARDFAVAQLASLGVAVTPSDTNFIFFLTPGNQDLQTFLLRKNIKIGQLKYAGKAYARVTIGTLEEMKAFVSTLERFFN